MNITETRIPQDGAIKGVVDGRELDMRVSVLPTNEGEKIVVRLLDYSQSLNGLDTLGFAPNNLKKIDIGKFTGSRNINFAIDNNNMLLNSALSYRHP